LIRDDLRITSASMRPRQPHRGNPKAVAKFIADQVQLQ
jgi:hypothetical protein